MPNWCTNNLLITGRKKELDRLMEYVKGEDNAFTFNSILPMPEDLRGSTSPSRIISQEEYDNIPADEKAKMDDPNNPFVSRPLTQAMSDKYLSLYGNDNWYDWSNDNWGTKWDTSDVEMRRYSDTELAYEFDTAWCPPEGVFGELVNQFPKLEFSLEWHEEGGESGILYGDEPLPERESSRAMNARIEAMVQAMSTKNKTMVWTTGREMS